MTGIVDDIAQLIRIVDGANRLKNETLAVEIEDFLHDRNIYAVERKPLANLLIRTNPDKTMDAGQMAELIVAEFGLDKEY